MSELNSTQLLAQEWNNNPHKTTKEIDSFYQNTTNYVGDLIAWNNSEYKQKLIKHILYSCEFFKARTVLDVGAGIMSDSIALSSNGFNVTSIDFDSEHYRYGKSRALGLPISTKHVGDDLGMHDVVLMLDVIEHVQNPDKFLDFYASKSNGLIFMTVPENIPPDESDRHPMHLVQYANFWNRIPAYLEEKHGFKRLDMVTFRKINPRILCSISTKNRYETYLPMAIMSVANQTQLPDHLTIYDDNDSPKDLREIRVYQDIFKLLDARGLGWDIVYGERRGSAHNHQKANKSGFDWVWRLDDDCVAEPNVLAKLKSYIKPGIGAIGGSILTPPASSYDGPKSSKIEDLHLPNSQWFRISNVQSVDHLNCSFLYRAGIVDYNLSLSPKGFREETMFTYGLKLMEYDVIIVPDCVTWDFHASGGIR